MPATRIEAVVDDHPAQERFVADRNSSTAYIGGVGSGKTTGGVLRAGRHVAEWNVGHKGVIVSPTVPMLRNVIVPELRKWGLLDKPGVEYRRSENIIEYPNGSTIILESANNDRKIERLRGLNLAWAWMDEAAYHPEKVYRILGDRLRRGDYRNLFATTTPRGFNWVYEEFINRDGKTSEPIADGRVVTTDDSTAIAGVSTRANPANPDDYIEREERQRSGEAYEQEIEGEFVQFEGLVYPWFDEENRITDPERLPDAWDKTIYGVDFGGSAPTAIVAVRVADGDYYVVDEFYEPRVTDDAIASELQRMYSEYGRGPVYCDHEPRTIQKLSRESIRAKEADKSVDEGIRHVNGLREHLFVLNECQNVVDEFNLYRYKDESDDVLKENDHLMDALRYCLFSEDASLSAGGAVIEW